MDRKSGKHIEGKHTFGQTMIPIQESFCKPKDLVSNIVVAVV